VTGGAQLVASPEAAVETVATTDPDETVATTDSDETVAATDPDETVEVATLSTTAGVVEVPVETVTAEVTVLTAWTVMNFVDVEVEVRVVVGSLLLPDAVEVALVAVTVA